MIGRKTLLGAGATALLAMPGIALAHGQNDQPHGQAGQHGKSHKCQPHRVGYVAAGTLVDQTLALDAGSSPETYSGDLTVAVTRTNHHARADKGTNKTYTLANARVRLDIADVNADGTVGLDDLVAGDRVRVIGKITVLAKKCDQTGFTATTTIRKVIVHAPATPAAPDSQES